MGLIFDVWPPGAEENAILIARAALEASGGDLVVARRQLLALIPAVSLPGGDEDGVAALTARTLTHPDIVALASTLAASRNTPPLPESPVVTADSTTPPAPARRPDTAQPAPPPATQAAQIDPQPPGRLVCVSSAANGSVRVWDVLNSAPISRRGPQVWGNVNSVALASAPDGRLLAALAFSGITIWDALSATSVGSIDVGLARRRPVSVALGTAHDGRVLCVAGCSDGSLLVGDALAGTSVATLAAGNPMPSLLPLNYPLALASARDGRMVCVSSANAEGAVRVWDVAEGQPIGSPLAGHGIVSSLALGTTPDGRFIAMAGGSEGTRHTLRVWDALAGTLIGEPLTGHSTDIQSVALGNAPDGRLIGLSVCTNRVVKAWDVLAGRTIDAQLNRQRNRLRAAATPVKKRARSVALASAPDGRLIAATGAQGGNVQFWDLLADVPLGPSLAGHTDVVKSLAMGIGSTP